MFLFGFIIRFALSRCGFRLRGSLSAVDRCGFLLFRGRFRIRADVLEIQPSYEDRAARISSGGTLPNASWRWTLTGEILAERDSIDIYPAKHFVTSQEKLTADLVDIRLELEERLDELRRQGKVLEAARLESRTNYDMEMLQVTQPGAAGLIEHCRGDFELPGPFVQDPREILADDGRFRKANHVLVPLLNHLAALT